MRKSWSRIDFGAILSGPHPPRRQGQVSDLVRRDIGHLQQKHLGAPRIYWAEQVKRGIPSSIVQADPAVERLTDIEYLEPRPRHHCLQESCPNVTPSRSVIRI